MDKKLIDTSRIAMCGVALLLATFSTTAAEAQRDPFLIGAEGHGPLVSELNEVERQGEESAVSTAIAELRGLEKQQEDQSFGSSVRRLLKNAGEDEASANSKWDDFEEVDETVPEEMYLSNEERIMREINSEPIRRPSPFGDKLGQIENDVRGLRAGSESKKNSLELELERIRPSQ